MSVIAIIDVQREEEEAEHTALENCSVSCEIERVTANQSHLGSVCLSPVAICRVWHSSPEYFCFQILSVSFVECCTVIHKRFKIREE